MQFTNQKILQVAMQQLALEYGCFWQDFISTTNQVHISKKNANARIYRQTPVTCSLASFGSNVVCATGVEYVEFVKKYLSSGTVEECFSLSKVSMLQQRLLQDGKQITFTGEYFLPDLSKLSSTVCGYRIKELSPIEFAPLYSEEWKNALCKERKEFDVLVVGAYDRDILVGLAGCSADSETMWQIGIDVLPSYRKKGIATALTSKAAQLVLENGKVPFYCATWSNIKSVRNALKSGFYPAWIEMNTMEL